MRGTNAAAGFELVIHRGEGAALIAMDWKAGPPPEDFIGFAIEYREPGGTKFFPLKNRLNFEESARDISSAARSQKFSTLVAPIQKFRWVHFPRNAQLEGEYEYKVTPIFMDVAGKLRSETEQTASLALADETYPGELNIAFTRGFISSQAFVDRYKVVDRYLPAYSKDGLTFTPQAKNAAEAYAWMGFEARRLVLKLLDDAIADQANGKVDVGVVAYDFDLPEILDRLIKLKGSVRAIIDNSEGHIGPKHAEDDAAIELTNHGIPVIRQSMKSLQHNKTIYVDGPTVKRAVGGSTNLSWRGLYVQSNNAVLLEGPRAVEVFKAAFEEYWSDADGFTASEPTAWASLDYPSVDASVSFSPHRADSARLDAIAADVKGAGSSVFYSLAFLWQTPGKIRDALQDRVDAGGVYVAGISEKATAIDVSGSSTNEKPVAVEPLGKNAPYPFKPEPTGLVDDKVGTRMHHKFIVVDFNTPQARVYTGSYNMSVAADTKNGENLLLIRDGRVATSYMVEALRLIDHYEFRVAQKNADTQLKELTLQRPPEDGGEPWWRKDWTEAHRIADRKLFTA
ncbi:phospholipase D-like domain-containing protein [Novosphingobium sp. BL-8A]|uniref:phospholipase D-like domain-containing protein n=1 Tax=Novosphingobium sp. BL-8A TaxID=3127639 RepID=UPI0037577E4A